MIGVEHNPDALSAYSRVWVRNLTAAKQLIRKVMDEKRPRGLRVRHSYDIMSNSVYLEAHSSTALHTIEHALEHARNSVRITHERIRRQNG